MAGNNIPSPDERERAQQALDLRLAGATWARVADRLSYADESGARHAAMRLLDRTDFELVAEYRDVEGARLERLLVAVWPAAVRGDPRRWKARASSSPSAPGCSASIWP
ncbi:hypothetical protein [Nocardia sp. NPDC051463]|uniref:hypothetical protein n=1 Tax=Nocardia sp. NPDC051463 TaxID=3154845 RepID=UPI00344F2E28